MYVNQRPKIDFMVDDFYFIVIYKMFSGLVTSEKSNLNNYNSGWSLQGNNNIEKELVSAKTYFIENVDTKQNKLFTDQFSDIAANGSEYYIKKYSKGVNPSADMITSNPKPINVKYIFNPDTPINLLPISRAKEFVGEIRSSERESYYDSSNAHILEDGAVTNGAPLTNASVAVKYNINNAPRITSTIYMNEIADGLVPVRLDAKISYGDILNKSAPTIDDSYVSAPIVAAEESGIDIRFKPYDNYNKVDSITYRTLIDEVNTAYEPAIIPYDPEMSTAPVTKQYELLEKINPILNVNNKSAYARSDNTFGHAPVAPDEFIISSVVTPQTYNTVSVDNQTSTVETDTKITNRIMVPVQGPRSTVNSFNTVDRGVVLKDTIDTSGFSIVS